MALVSRAPSTAQTASPSSPVRPASPATGSTATAARPSARAPSPASKNGKLTVLGRHRHRRARIDVAGVAARHQLRRSPPSRGLHPPRRPHRARRAHRARHDPWSRGKKSRPSARSNTRVGRPPRTGAGSTASTTTRVRPGSSRSRSPSGSRRSAPQRSEERQRGPRPRRAAHHDRPRRRPRPAPRPRRPAAAGRHADTTTPGDRGRPFPGAHSGALRNMDPPARRRQQGNGHEI